MSKLYPSLSIMIVLLIVIGLPLLLSVNQTRQEIRQHAAGSLYPANIEFDGNIPGSYGYYVPSNLINPTISGVDIVMNWSEVEPNEGAINWAPLDKEMADWVSHGKKFTLIIRYSTNKNNIVCTSQLDQFLPAWEAAKNPSLCTSGGSIIPDYFDANFKADLKAYISAIAQHIAASQYKSSLAYVRIGLGVAGEGYPCLSCNTQDLQKLNSWGYTITNWKNWQEEMLSSFKSMFSYTNLIYALGYQDVDPSTGQPVDQEVAYWAAAQGIGIGQQGLANNPGYANGASVQISKYVRAHYPNTYIQFQTNHQISGNINPPDPEVQGDIAISESAGAFSIEWYGTDATNVAFQPYFHQWQQMVDKRTGGIGTGTPTITTTPTSKQLSPTPIPSVTKSPSSTATPSQIPNPSISLQPTPTIVPGDTSFGFVFCPHGIFNCGDNVASQSGGNKNILHTQRSITISVFDNTNKQVMSKQGLSNYDTIEGHFWAYTDMDKLATGSYLVKIKTDGFLQASFAGIQSVTVGKQNILDPHTRLVAGDIDNNNQLDILDYNILISCFGSKQNTPSCITPPTAESSGADINDDGHIDGIDYNLFLRELSVQKGG